MEFTDMRGLEVRPGLLTVWRPVPGGRAAPRWQADERPASYAQEAHLAGRLANPRAEPAAVSPSWLATVFDLPGPLDAAALETALLAWIDRHESLRSRLVPTEPAKERAAEPAPGTAIRRVTLAPGTVGMRRSVAGSYRDGGELAARIEELFDRETGPLGWPSYLFATVAHTGDGPGPGSVTLYVGLDHSNVDGYSILLAAYEIRELYGAAVRGGRARLGEVGSYLDFAGCERAGAALVGRDHEAVVRWREFIAAGGGRLPAFPSPVGREGGEGPAGCGAQPGGLVWLLNAAQARAFERACRKGGGNLFAGVLACLAREAHRGAGAGEGVPAAGAAGGGSGGEFRALMPVHTRTHARWSQSVGWFVGLAPLRFAVRAGGSFAEAMAGAAAALEGARPMAEVPLARVAELLGVPLEPRFMVSYMDFRRVPGAREWGEWRAAALRSRRVHAHEVYLWVNRSFEGVYLSFRYPDTVRGRAEVPRYVENVRRAVARVAAAGAGDRTAARRPAAVREVAAVCG
ncbi:hypothetical protein [Streptomyces sp. NPDC008001]|uniref:hypothetical protein n=1 Tax=Streptomyces sp. NPDC008001 TaxID=3364804 RepID=UPI0036E9AC3A